MSKNSLVLFVLPTLISCKESKTRVGVTLSEFFLVKDVAYQYEDNCNNDSLLFVKDMNVSFSNNWNDVLMVRSSDKVVFLDYVVTNRTIGIAQQNFSIPYNENDTGNLIVYVFNSRTQFSIKNNSNYRYVKLFKRFDNSIIVRMSNCTSIVY